MEFVSEIGPDVHARLGFDVVPRESSLDVAIVERAGAPAVPMRSGEPADLPFIADISASYARGAGVALERTPDAEFMMVKALTRKELPALQPVVFWQSDVF